MRNSSQYLHEENTCVQLPLIHSSSHQKGAKGKSNRFTRPIVINLGDTQYQVVQEVSEEMGWKVEYSDQKSWDIKWTDTAVLADTLSKMSRHQKINHFPGMHVLSRKNTLTKNIQRMQQSYAEQYSFYPRTFLLPSDLHKLKAYYQQSKKQNSSKTYIVKPEAGCQGRGIFLTQNIQQIQPYEHCIVQKYLTNPLLYKNLKFDLRVYALVAGCDPLRIYIYNEGLTRFATQKYRPPQESNMDNLFMHLTNYAINKDHPNYIYNDSVNNLSFGHKKSLAEFFQTLKGLGCKAHLFWSEIKDTIVKTLIAGQPHLQHEYRMSQPHNLENNMCFQILGFDFMLDASGKCYLLEVNHTPSFSTDTPLDELVKSNLIRDTLCLMNINSKTRDKTLSELRSEQERRVFTGKTKKYTSDERKLKIEELQKVREEYERHHLGSFEKIFPSKNVAKQKKYEQLLEFSLDSYKRSTGNGIKQSIISANSKLNKSHSPSKFRVKKLITRQALEDEKQKAPHQPPLNEFENTINTVKKVSQKEKAAEYVRNISTTSVNKREVSKVTTQQVGSQINSKHNPNSGEQQVLNPEKTLKLHHDIKYGEINFVNLASNQSTKQPNGNYCQNQQSSQNKSYRQQTAPQSVITQKDHHESFRISKELNGAGQIRQQGTIQRQSFNRTEEQIQSKQQKGIFLRTKPEEKTMFSKMLISK